MTELPDNILDLPQYQVLGCKSTDDEMHFQVDVPDPIACEECGVQGEFVRFGKRDVPYRDLPIHGKRVTLWVVRRRYTCRACKTTFRPQLPEMVDGFRMTLRLHEYVEKESFNHPYTFVAAQTGLDEKTVRDGFWLKVARFAGKLPFAEDLLAAYYCAFDRQTPRHVQAALLGAIAYFILPFDFIPDMLPVLGFTDDAAVLATAIRMVASHITPEHREAARAALKRGVPENAE